jgi:uncharacterized protein YecA (UPF0149 family)
MTDFNIKEVLPILKAFGISPEQLGPEKMKHVQDFAKNITNPKDMTEKDSNDFLRNIGVSINQGALKKKIPKIKRNVKCPCGSGKKYKVCCII